MGTLNQKKEENIKLFNIFVSGHWLGTGDDEKRQLHAVSKSLNKQWHDSLPSTTSTKREVIKQVFEAYGT